MLILLLFQDTDDPEYKSTLSIFCYVFILLGPFLSTSLVHTYTTNITLKSLPEEPLTVTSSKLTILHHYRLLDPLSQGPFSLSFTLSELHSCRNHKSTKKIDSSHTLLLGVKNPSWTESFLRRRNPLHFP